MSVLILEDNIQTMRILQEMVHSVSDKEEIYTAEDAAQAYKIAMETSIDLFLLDIILNGGIKSDTSGIKYAQHIRQVDRYRFTPVIFVTSLEDPQMYAYRDLHCFGYIEKPFRRQEVINLIREALYFRTEREKDTTLFFRKDGILYPVKCSSIVYMEMVRRQTVIHMKSNDMLNIGYKSFREILHEANSEKFVQCSRSCVINSEYIKNIDKTNRFISLNGVGKNIEIGTSYMKKVFKRLGIC